MDFKSFLYCRVYKKSGSLPFILQVKQEQPLKVFFDHPSFMFPVIKYVLNSSDLKSNIISLLKTKKKDEIVPNVLSITVLFWYPWKFIFVILYQRYGGDSTAFKFTFKTSVSLLMVRYIAPAKTQVKQALCWGKYTEQKDWVEVPTERKQQFLHIHSSVPLHKAEAIMAVFPYIKVQHCFFQDVTLCFTCPCFFTNRIWFSHCAALRGAVMSLCVVWTLLC